MSFGQNKPPKEQWIEDDKEKAKVRQRTHGRKPMRGEKAAKKAQEDYAFPGNAFKRDHCDRNPDEAFMPEYRD